MKHAEVESPTILPGNSLAPLGSILCTEELSCRPSRPPDYEKENSALVKLVSALADSPRTILQTLTETIREITQSDSAGVSLLTSDEGKITSDEGGKRFYWPAIAGMWNGFVGGGLPRDFAPCGAVIDRNCTLLFTQVTELYPILRPVLPRAEQLLCVPFYIGGRAVGTIWAIMHSDRRKFDAEDDRVMSSLGKFASSAYQAVMSIDDLKFQVAEREKAEAELRQLTEGLETQVRVRTQELEQRNAQLGEAKALLAEEKLALERSEAYARSHVEVMMRSLDVLATEAAPEKFIAEMLRTIGQRLGARGVLLWLRNQEDDSLRLRLMIKDDQQVAPDPDHPFVKDPQAWQRSPPFQEMVFTKGPVVCDDIERDPRIGAELREYLMDRGRKKFLAIPMFVLGEVRGFIGIQHGERGAYRPEEVELAQALAHHVMIAAHEAELGEQRRHAVILEERTRLARDIHDTLAQGFIGIIVQLEAMAAAISCREPKKVNACLQRASDLARQSLNEARRSVHALRPEALERANFWEALQGIIKNTAAATTLRTKSKLRGELPQLRLDWQEDLMRIGQEALTNTLKYAHADTFETQLVSHPNKLRLEFQDDGDGFDIKEQHDGFGLAGMRERVKRMGGKLTITSSRGRGTKITVILPINGQCTNESEKENGAEA